MVNCRACLVSCLFNVSICKSFEKWPKRSCVLCYTKMFFRLQCRMLTKIFSNFNGPKNWGLLGAWFPFALTRYKERKSRAPSRNARKRNELNWRQRRRSENSTMRYLIGKEKTAIGVHCWKLLSRCHMMKFWLHLGNLCSNNTGIWDWTRRFFGV